jgi:hypothetical protein
MRPRDRTILRGVLAAVVLGTGAAAIGASCLARDAARRAEYVATELGRERMTGGAQPPTLRWDAPPPAAPPAAPAPAPPPPAEEPEEPVATTETTGAEVPTSPQVAPPAHPAQPTMADPVAPLDVPPPQTDAPTGDTGGTDGGLTTADAGTTAPQAPPYYGPSFSAGAGPFLTEPDPFGASAFESNPNAGAGPFTTERPWPPQQPEE